MGACYSVIIKTKLHDETGAIKALNEHIANDTHTSYSLERYAAVGVTPDSFDGLMRILLAEVQQKVSVSQKGCFTVYENDFEASCGWESVMMEWFDILAPFLEDGSELLIYPNNDYDMLVIEDGECFQLH